MWRDSFKLSSSQSVRTLPSAADDIRFRVPTELALVEATANRPANIVVKTWSTVTISNCQTHYRSLCSLSNGQLNIR